MNRASVRIGVVAPACALAPGAAEKVAAFAAARYGGAAEIVFHPQCFLSEGHFAGPDAARAAAFLEVANDPGFDAVWFARGGYGSMRLDEAVFARLNAAARAKTYLGYSDLGYVLARLYRERIGRPVHGPMPSDINRADGESAIARALDFLVNGDRSGFEPSLRESEHYAAFNLTILAHLAATRFMPDLSSHIVMLEDVSEYMYRIDRALFAVTSSPALAGAKGIMLGRVSDVPVNDPDFLYTEEDVARYWCARAEIPYLGRAEIGHDGANRLVPFGPLRTA